MLRVVSLLSSSSPRLRRVRCCHHTVAQCRARAQRARSWHAPRLSPPRLPRLPECRTAALKCEHSECGDNAHGPCTASTAKSRVRWFSVVVLAFPWALAWTWQRWSWRQCLPSLTHCGRALSVRLRQRLVDVLSVEAWLLNYGSMYDLVAAVWRLLVVTNLVWMSQQIGIESR